MQKTTSKKHIIWLNLTLLVVAVALMYWETFEYWIHTWIHDFNYQAGFIMPFLALYVAWKRRYLFAYTPVKPSKTGLLIVTFGMLLYITGQVAYTKTAQQFSFFIFLPGIIWYLFGFHVLRTLIIPIVILIFMTPYAIPFYCYAQTFVSQICVKILHAFGAPVYLDGFTMHLPNLRLQVAAGCTGIRFLSVSIPIGLSLAWIYFDSRWKKITMTAFSVILPVVVNLIRILGLTFLALQGNEIFVRGTAHKIYGYALLLGTLPLLFVFAYYLNKFRVGPTAQSTKKVAPTNLQGQSWSQGLASYGNLILLVLLILIPMLVHTKLITQSPVPLLQNFASFPTILGKWKGNETADHEWHPKIIGAEDNMRRLYKNNEGDEIRVYVSYLPIQTQGQELVYHANTIIPDKFKYKNRNVRTWTINSGSHKLNLKTFYYLSKNGLYDEILIYWYQNTSHYLHSDYAAKAYMALDNLIKNRSNGAAFVLIFKVSIRDKKDHEIELQDFLNVFMSEIIKYLPA